MKGKILVVDDTALNVKVLQDVLTFKGYEVVTASGGVAALQIATSQKPDLILLDVMMPDMNGYDVCRSVRLNPDAKISTIPVIMITALDPNKERITGLEAGADDFLPKPINQPELLARVASLIRLKQYQNTILDQASKLAWMNETLEKRVKTQVEEIDRLGKLKEFFSPQIMQSILNEGEGILKIHRRNIVVIFLDLRGFTSFTDNSEPEEVMNVLNSYHKVMGELITSHQATMGHFAGDGIMVYFNDPIPIDKPVDAAVQLCVKMQENFKSLKASWDKQGFNLNLGVGFAQGYATLGLVGFEGNWTYTCIGSVCNLASRLCSEAQGGEILTIQKTHLLIEEVVKAEVGTEVQLKGISKPVQVVKILGLK